MQKRALAGKSYFRHKKENTFASHKLCLLNSRINLSYDELQKYAPRTENCQLWNLLYNALVFRR